MDGTTSSPPSIRHAWRVEVAHGRIGRSGRLAKSFENTTTSATGYLQVVCIATTLRHMSREGGRRRPGAPTGRSPVYRNATAHRLSVLLRISRELDIVGDVTATVDNPADLLAWSDTLPEPVVCAWR